MLPNVHDAAWPPEWADLPLAKYPRGTTLFREGDVPRFVHWVVTGSVKLSIESDGGLTVLGLRGPGTILGSMATIAGGSHTATAMTITPCEIRLIPSREFVAAVTAKGMATHLAGLWAGEMLDGHQWQARAQLGAKSALEGLIVTLFVIAGEERRDGSWKLRDDIALQELADEIGKTRQWTSGCIREWKRDGILAREHGWWVLPASSPLIARVREQVRVKRK